ncbi:hypothetical protein [Thaumasiovibrio subtropicus]|uniref:hypothetical protein n=1 Tax=Thaumasiovibrio subtropicus TaxID=1891207 RepID=UPI000B363A83|nr:hypothetical protein [Thaumasiovibrio subtropicus]
MEENLKQISDELSKKGISKQKVMARYVDVIDRLYSMGYSYKFMVERINFHLTTADQAVSYGVFRQMLSRARGKNKADTPSKEKEVASMVDSESLDENDFNHWKRNIPHLSKDIYQDAIEANLTLDEVLNMGTQTTQSLIMKVTTAANIRSRRNKK